MMALIFIFHDKISSRTRTATPRRILQKETMEEANTAIGSIY